MTEEQNNKFFHVLGLDIMFDTDFNAWLFETNRFPSMDIFFNQENAEGVNIRKRSKIDEKIKGTLLHETFKILVGKQTSEHLEPIYDSSVDGSEDNSFIYEKVFEVYKKLSGNDIKQEITIADFYKILNFIPTSGEEDPINLELVIQKLHLQEQATFGLIEVFTALKY